MKQYMKTFNIQPVSKELEKKLQHKIDNKTKPLGALGQLEKIAVQIGLIQHTLSPELKPQEVTFQMVMNFLNGGAAINVFCKQNDIAIKVVDAGVNYEFPPALDKIIDSKIAMGTKSFLDGPAMSEEEVRECINRGATLVTEIAEKGCNVIGFGEMGIGNTTSASALMHLICKIPVKECVGKGTGLDDKGLQKKTNILRIALANNEGMDGPLNILATFGGFEIAQICGAMLQAAENKMLILVDGFISSAAFLVAHAMHPAIMEYAIFCHQSDEQGHAKMLNHLNVKSLLNLNLRLGEGTGVAMAYPLIQAAVHFINEMASFESAGVSNKE
jgi:nicotinate-nucleotide--dimethylbenzimidazole phosphoribosyltransferase